MYLAPDSGPGQESKPRPARSRARSQRLRWPSLTSARARDFLVRLIPTERSGSGGKGIGFFQAQVKNLEELNKIIHELGRLKGVQQVERVLDFRGE